MTDAPEKIWVHYEPGTDDAMWSEYNVDEGLDEYTHYGEYTRSDLPPSAEVIRGMIKPLVWRDITAGLGTDEYFIMPVKSSGEYRVYGIEGSFDSSAQYPTLEAAQAAANEHHATTILAALGLTE